MIELKKGNNWMIAQNKNILRAATSKKVFQPVASGSFSLFLLAVALFFC